MTIKEAMQQRIPRVRKSFWASENCYLRLPLMADGKAGAWAELYDETVQPIIDVPVGSQRICIALPDVANEPGYEAYTGIMSEHEKDKGRFARVYVES